MGGSNPETVKFVMPPDVIREKHQVQGTIVHVASLYIGAGQATELKQSLSEESGEIISVLSTSLRRMIGEHNTYVDVLQPFGVYRCVLFLLILWNIVLGLYILRHVREVVLFFNQGKKNKAAQMALAMRMLILMPELIGSILGVFIIFDPFGAFYTTDYITARSLITMRASLTAFTDVVVIFYCTDVYQAFKKSRNNDRHVPFLVRHRFAFLLMLTLAWE